MRGGAICLLVLALAGCGGGGKKIAVRFESDMARQDSKASFAA